MMPMTGAWVMAAILAYSRARCELAAACSSSALRQARDEEQGTRPLPMAGSPAPHPELAEGRTMAMTAFNRRASVNVGPDLALGGVEEAGHHQEEDDDLGAGALAVLLRRLGRPGEEGHDVARFIRQIRLGAVGEFDVVAGERRRHRNLVIAGGE